MPVALGAGSSATTGSSSHAICLRLLTSNRSPTSCDLLLLIKNYQFLSIFTRIFTDMTRSMGVEELAALVVTQAAVGAALAVTAHAPTRAPQIQHRPVGIQCGQCRRTIRRVVVRARGPIRHSSGSVTLVLDSWAAA